METEQIEALRAALHRWIDQASAEQVVRVDREVQSILADDKVTWPEEEQSDNMVRRGPKVLENGMLQYTVKRLPAEEQEEPQSRRYTIRYVNDQGEETDGYGRVLTATDRNKRNERNRRHADHLARRGWLLSHKATPEELAAWDAANPDPLLDEDED